MAQKRGGGVPTPLSLPLNPSPQKGGERQTDTAAIFRKVGKGGAGGRCFLTFYPPHTISFRSRRRPFSQRGPPTRDFPSLLLHLSVVQHSPVNTPFFCRSDTTKRRRRRLVQRERMQTGTINLSLLLLLSPQPLFHPRRRFLPLPLQF